MLSKKILILTFGIFIVLACISFISAGSLSIEPGNASKYGKLTITIDASIYSRFLYFYSVTSSQEYIIDFLCEGETCSGGRTFEFDLSNAVDEGGLFFIPGDYMVRIYSFSDSGWLTSSFSVMGEACSDGTVHGQCSATKPLYCDDGNLINRCWKCGCSEGERCEEKSGICAIPEPEEFCGDGNCDIGETCSSCEADCGICPGVCGNSVIETGEECDDGNIVNGDGCDSTCQEEEYCGDGVCNSGENCLTCLQDCPCPFGETCQPDGTCVSVQPPAVNCGDGTCSLDENCLTCEDDCRCSQHYNCQPDGTCKISYAFPVGANAKDMSLYSSKEAFLISDKDWKTVLPFVSATTWTDNSGEIHKYPFLIYHDDYYSYTLHDTLLRTGQIYNGNYDIDGNLIVYSAPDGLLVYNILAEERKNIDSSSQIWFKISGDNIIWYVFNQDGDCEVYLYNLLTETKENIFTNENQLDSLSFSGNKIAWMERVGQVDSGGGFYRVVYDLYLYDIQTRTKTKLAENIFGGEITTSEDYIVWTEFVDKQHRYLNIYDISSQQATRVEFPYVWDVFISGDKMVFVYNWDIYLYDILTGQQTQITTNPADDHSPQISEDKVVWQREGDVYMYDIQTMQETAIADSVFPESSPEISNNRIVFCRDNCDNGLSLYNPEINEVYESSSFDADSIIYLMQQYSPDKLTVIGETPQELDNLLVAEPELGAGLSEENIQRLNPEDYVYYWQQFDTIVYVEDNYELALLASTYASLINAPLVIEGTEADSSDVFFGRDVICVGNVVPSGSYCKEEYNLESLQQKYFDETQTDKIILINPDDWNIKSNKEYVPDKSPRIYNLYTKHSLASPFLASAKHELLIPVKSTDYQEIDNLFTAKLRQYFNIPETSAEKLPYFLTIIASPDAIPISRPSTEEDGCFCSMFSCVSQVEADGRIYGSLDDYGIINLPVGRIMGVSSSDVSGYVARDIFFDELPKNKDALVVIGGDYQKEINDICGELGITQDCNINELALEEYARRYFWTDEMRNEFNQESFYSGHEEVSLKVTEIYEKYDNVYLNLFDDHGYPEGFVGMMDSSFMINNKMYLQPSIILGLACSTCDYSGGGELFCVQGIRRGALVQQGAVDVSYWHQEFDNVLRSIISQSRTIGDAYLEARNEEYGINHDNYCTGLRGDSYYALLGDPTFRPNYWDSQVSEICDNLDNNGNGQVDEGCDDDDDDYCNKWMGIVGTPSTCSLGGGDCVDTNKIINPGVGETCDRIDNDCDGQIDNDCDESSLCLNTDESCGVEYPCKDCTAETKNYCMYVNSEKVGIKTKECETSSHTCRWKTTGIFIEDCALRTPANLYCSAGEDVKGQYYRCGSGECKLRTLAWVVEDCPNGCTTAGTEGAHCKDCRNAVDNDCGTTPADEYKCYSNIVQKRTHKGKGCNADTGACYNNGWNDWEFIEVCSIPSDEYRCSGSIKQKRTYKGNSCVQSGTSASCDDEGWNSWTNVGDCGTTPANEMWCGVWYTSRLWTKTHKGKGCDPGVVEIGRCYDYKWNDATYIDCALGCSDTNGAHCITTGECICPSLDYRNCAEEVYDNCGNLCGTGRECSGGDICTDTGCQPM